jgi:hypothetical protein
MTQHSERSSPKEIDNSKTRSAYRRSGRDSEYATRWRSIKALAKRRLADEYDAAQERGEVVGPADRRSNSRPEANKATASDIGLTHKEIHEARQVRDAIRRSSECWSNRRDIRAQNGEGADLLQKPCTAEVNRRDCLPRLRVG